MRGRKATVLAAILLMITTMVTVNVATAGPAAADACFTWTRSLSSGAVGGDVAELQKRIAGWMSYGENLTLDGDFGPATTAALRRFQAGYGLTADGIAGPQTYNKLYELQNDDCTPVHFSHAEMSQNCGAYNYQGGAVSAATARDNALRVMWQLEALRHKLGDWPLDLSDGFRGYSCNSSTGGASDSNHLYGSAADIVGSPSLCTIAQAARYAGFEQILGPGYPDHYDHIHVANQGSQWWSAPNCGI